MLARAADAADAERRPLGEAVALTGQERRVGGDDDDDRAARPRGPGCGGGLLPGKRPDRGSVHAQPVTAAVVGLDEHADGGAVDDAGGRPDSALEPVALHAGAAADAAFGDRPGG